MMRLSYGWAIALATALTAGCAVGRFPHGDPASSVRSAVRAAAVAPPAVTEIPSPNFDDQPSRSIRVIVLHHTASLSTAQDTARFFQDPASKVSSHYIVDRSGAIVRCVPDDKRAWHAGQSAFDGVPDVNSYSVGIEISNVGDGVEPYPKEQVDSIVRLVAWLATTYQVPLTNMTRHRDIALPVGRKHDTSDNFDEAYVANAVQALINGQSPKPYHASVAPVGYDPTRQFHVVKPGDTWELIAEEHFDTRSMAKAIASLNQGVPLVSGNVLALPTNYRGF